MELNEEGLKDRTAWEQAGYRLPLYDRAEMVRRTKEAPEWVHFGAGNIFRAFPAHVAEELQNRGILDRGIVAVEGFDRDLIARAYRPFDNYCVLVTLKTDGTLEKCVIGSVAESRCIVPDPCAKEDPASDDWERMNAIFQNPSLRMATFTITEKGYAILDAAGNPLPEVRADFRNGPGGGEAGKHAIPGSYVGKVAGLLYRRFEAGKLPLALVSLDNCSENGRKLKEALQAYGQEWTERKLVDPGFNDYLSDGSRISCPWTMIDKITPRPDEEVLARLERDGITGLTPSVTEGGTYAAPFVNAEECGYLVIEDHFPAGRPPLEQGGVRFTDRETVKKVERMKVSTCLNPLHTALAVFGCLLGFRRIHEEMRDPDLLRLVERIGYVEGLPVVTDPGILNPERFLSEVLQERLPSRFLPDSPQRIATDTSQKLSVRFGETVKAYRDAGMPMERLVAVPLVYAGWLRYLLGVDDTGKAFEVSPDPRLAELRGYLSGIRWNMAEKQAENVINTADVPEAVSGPSESDFLSGSDLFSEAKQFAGVEELLAREDIFGLNLMEAGLGQRVIRYLERMLSGPGAVRRLLEETE